MEDFETQRRGERRESLRVGQVWLAGGLWGYDSLNKSKFSDIKHPQRTLPFDSLDPCNEEHVEWLKSQRDPEL